jgi:hypothetical protein
MYIYMYIYIYIYRSSKDIVCDAANTVLTYIKTKIMTHINLLKAKKDLFDNPPIKEDSTVGTYVHMDDVRTYV